MEGEDEDQFLNIPNLQQRDLSHPYITGKIVVMDKGDSDLPPPENGSYWSANGFDELVLDKLCDLEGVFYHCSEQVDGDEKLLAASPSEVGTIIWIECIEEDIGTYAYQGDGYQTTCTVTVIDKAASRIVGEKTFPTTQPPNEIGCGAPPCNCLWPCAIR